MQLQAGPPARATRARLAQAGAPEHRPWLRALHDEDSAEVLAALLAEPEIGVYQLSDDLGLSRKVIRSNLAQLMETGVVVKRGTARPRYLLAKPSDEVEELLRLSRKPPFEPL